MAESVLVAGVGNVFLGDDGFGVEVARRMAASSLPPGVRVADFGIRAVHLAYEILERPAGLTILVDATRRGGPPGTVYLIEPDLGRLSEEEWGQADAHAMRPEAVFAWLSRLGAAPGRLLLVGCEPERLDEEQGLSSRVAEAVDRAIDLILDVVARGTAPAATPGVPPA
ncbi:MAG: hydrogenase maturation protease [Acidobacteria bacterium]|nr:MAG: hydrogenase maturation protease [Acidobacteriota bacterium]